MYLSAKHLNGFEIRSNGDVLGRLADLFFDAQTWDIRYTVMDTGGWLMGRRVMLSRDAIDSTDFQGHALCVTATKQQVENSPGIDLLRPVSPKDLAAIHKHYGWPAFQGLPIVTPTVPMGFLAPPTPYNSPDNPDVPCAEATDAEGEEQVAQFCFTAEASAHANSSDVHLRSMNEVDGYHILAQDGGLGHVQDFLLEEADWSVRYLVVDTRNWIPGRVVLLPPKFVSEVDWQESTVRVNLTREQVRTSPEYNHSVPLSPEYEHNLREHYGVKEAQP